MLEGLEHGCLGRGVVFYYNTWFTCKGCEPEDEVSYASCYISLAGIH